MLVPVYLPRYVETRLASCDCMNDRVDMEFKTAQLTWLKTTGEAVGENEAICEAETEKVIFDIIAPQAGIIYEILVQNGDSCSLGDILCYIEIV